ncbi:DUF3892 domain-containing protein [Microbispora bryophytorum]|uniref:DUF3892 domain-containing protein n=1 Tax=Microbispora bryophytorum TaxID=1460882 RepID=UPI0037212124
MAIKFTARRMSGGQQHEHIARLWWINPSTGSTGDNTREYLVEWIEKGNKAYCEDAAGRRADVGVRTSTHGVKYLQTHADGVWTNNLLALPLK